MSKFAIRNICHSRRTKMKTAKLKGYQLHGTPRSTARRERASSASTAPSGGTTYCATVQDAPTSSTFRLPSDRRYPLQTCSVTKSGKTRGQALRRITAPETNHPKLGIFVPSAPNSSAFCFQECRFALQEQFFTCIATLNLDISFQRLPSISQLILLLAPVL